MVAHFVRVRRREEIIGRESGGVGGAAHQSVRHLCSVGGNQPFPTLKKKTHKTKKKMQICQKLPLIMHVQLRITNNNGQ